SSTLTIGVELHPLGLAARVAVVPLGAEGTVVAFRVHERMGLDAGTLRSSAYEDRTSVSVELPAIIERRAEDAVLVGPGDSLGLVGASRDREWVRLIVLAPDVDR